MPISGKCLLELDDVENKWKVLVSLIPRGFLVITSYIDLHIGVPISTKDGKYSSRITQRFVFWAEFEVS